VLPSADTAAMLFWALLASGQTSMRKVDGWKTPALVKTEVSLSNKNASLEPIDCEQFDPLSATNAGRPKITAARKKRIRKLD
jgi:hypothetical protein